MKNLSGRLRGPRLSAAVWAISCFCVIIFAYNAAVVGGVLGVVSFQRQFPQMDTIDTTGAEQHSNAQIQGTIVALFTLLGAFGALACTFLGDIYGRRWTIFVACGGELVGVILMGTSFHFAQFIVSRVILGLGTGGVLATVSIWQAELSKPHSRGSHVSGFGIAAGIGIALALWIDFGTHFVSSSFSWRFPFLIQVLFPIVVMTFIFTLPESPRWLVKTKRNEQARKVFSAIYGVEPKAGLIDRLIQDIQTALEVGEDTSLKSLFTMGPQRTFHRLILAASAQMFLQMSGINSITYYNATVYQEYLGFSQTTAGILAASAQFVVIFGSCVCSFTVDRFGRRKLMMLSACGMVICQACLAGLTSNLENKTALKAAVFFLYLYFFLYTLGFLGIPFLYASEVAPIHLRAAVCGISTATSWIFNFLVAEITPVAFNDIGYRFFIVFAAINLACVPIVYWFYPETNGRTLEEIDEIFVKSKNIFDPVKVAKRMPRRQVGQVLADETEKEQAIERIENTDLEQGGKGLAAEKA